MSDAEFVAQRQRMVAEIAVHTVLLTGRLDKAALSRRVMEAMAKVPRHLFVRAELQEMAYADTPLPTDCGKTISQPFIVALMTDLLDLQPGDRVLEVGTGFGYQSAVLAELAAHVCTVELIPELAREARRRLLHVGCGRVDIRVGDGRAGWPERAPFDKIIVTAAPDWVPVGCFHLRVLDSGNNGITNGGYVLSNAQGKRIIDATGAFTSVSQINDQAVSRTFCLPIGPLNMLGNWCDRTNLLIQSPIYCSSYPGSTGYQFWIYDPHGTYNRRVLVPSTSFVPNTLNANPVPVNRNLNVRVRPLVNGNYLEFGPACRIRFVPNSTGRGMEVLEGELGVDQQVVTLSIYPNPNRDGQVTVTMEGLSVEEETAVEVDIYDMLGKRVHAERAIAAQGILNHPMDLSHDLGEGMYMVNVTVNGKLYTQRLVRQ